MPERYHVVLLPFTSPSAFCMRNVIFFTLAFCEFPRPFARGILFPVPLAFYKSPIPIAWRETLLVYAYLMQVLYAFCMRKMLLPIIAYLL